MDRGAAAQEVAADAAQAAAAASQQLALAMDLIAAQGRCAGGGLSSSEGQEQSLFLTIDLSFTLSFLVLFIHIYIFCLYYLSFLSPPSSSAVPFLGLSVLPSVSCNSPHSR